MRFLLIFEDDNGDGKGPRKWVIVVLVGVLIIEIAVAVIAASVRGLF